MMVQGKSGDVECAHCGELVPAPKDGGSAACPSCGEPMPFEEPLSDADKMATKETVRFKRLRPLQGRR